uniref:Reverse transcriptase domain-containing protein n=1 Tax=Tanacetum cinerariifolium TaxID=118510 RepID=A0A6L2NQC4_TANCI|nr:reverse transcriptase domain-containing protein [Tanacetum cinerariifolium]
MTTLADKVILLDADNCPPMLEKDMYDSWKIRMELYMMNRQHGRMIFESVKNGPLIWPTIKESGVTRPRKYSELTHAEAIQADCDVKDVEMKDTYTVACNFNVGSRSKLRESHEPRWDYDPGKLWCCFGFIVRLVSNPSSNPTPSINPNLKGRNRRCSKQRIEDFNLEELSPPIVTMADQRTMAQLLQAPTEGYEDAIVVPAITADNFELKHGLLTLVQNKHEAWDRFKDLLRPCPHHGFSELHQLDTFYNALNSKNQDSLNFAAGGNFLDKMPRECIAIIESKSKVRYSCNKPVVAKVSTNTSTFGISPDVAELKDMVKALLLDNKGQSQSPTPMKEVEESCVTCGGAHSYRNCPATDGNVYRDNIQQFVSQAFANVPRNTQNRFIPNQNRNNFNQGHVYQPSVFRPLAYQAPAYQALAPQTQGVSMEDFSTYVKANDAVMRNIASTSSSSTPPSNTIANSRSDLKAITTRSGVSYDGPKIPPSTSFLPKVVEDEPEVAKDTVNPTNNGSPEDIQPQVVQSESPILTSEPVTSLISKPAIAPIFKYMSFKISFDDALILMPKFASTLKALIGNKEKLSEMARTPLNEHCSAVLLKKLPEKLVDPGKFLIPCDFLGMAECLALVDLGANINLMPFLVWKRLSLPDLTPTCMTLELYDRLISRPVGVAEDVYVKVGSFYFSADFVVVDFNADPRVPLILRRSFLKTRRALIDVFEGDLTLRVGKEAITFNLDQTSRYSANYNDMMAKRIDVIDMACEEYSQEVLGFSDTISSGNPTPYYDLIVSTTSPTLTPFRNSDFLLEEVDAFLAIEDDPTSLEFYEPYLDPEGGILLLEAFLNDDPSPPLNQGNYLSKFRKELKIFEAKSDKSSVDEPLEVKLKDLPPHIEYAFLEGDDKLPVIIVKDLSVEEKTALITVLKPHKRAIACKLSDIKGIDPEFCTYKILMEEDFEPAVQHQRRVNPKIHDVIKQEVIKLLEAGLIYPISDSPWVSPVHCVPRKGWFTIVENEDNELILTRLDTGWRVCIDYRKLNEATRKDHFPVPFMDQMLEILAGNQYDCFLDGFFGYFQIPIDPKDQEKTTFTCPYRMFTYRRMPFGLCNAPGTFQKLTEAPIFIAPDWDMPFELMSDASDYAISAVLGQRQDKHFRIIHYASKTMTEAESNYTTTKKEMLAMVYAFEKFRSYLIMNKSIVYTDHSALKYLFAKKDSKARLLRWVLLLQEFTFKVIDTKGAENLAADHLS